MEQEKRSHRFELNREGLFNMAAKLAVFAGWTGLVYLTAYTFNWLGDGLAATDLLTLGMEVGGGLIIAHSDKLIQQDNRHP